MLYIKIKSNHATLYSVTNNCSSLIRIQSCFDRKCSGGNSPAEIEFEAKQE